MLNSLKTTMATLIALALAAGGAAAQEVVVGFQAPLTGSQSQYGELFRNAAQLMVEQVNAKGGIHKQKVEVIFQDSKGDPKEGVAIAQKFAEDKRIVGVLGDFGSTVSMAAAEVYSRAGMPQLTPSSSHPDFTKISRWQFRNIFTQEHEGVYVGKWLRDSGLNRIAMIAFQNDFGHAVVDHIGKNFEQRGGQVVEREFFNPGTRDFRAILTKISRSSPDAIYLGAFYEEGAQIMQQAKQLGLNIKFFSGAAIFSPKLIELGGAAVEGMRCTTAFLPSLPAPHVRAFVESYRARYGVEPTYFAGQAYDAMGIMLAAIGRAGPKATRAQVRDELEQTTDYPGVTGLTTFDKRTHETHKDFIKVEIKNGQFVKLPD